jgi:PAS domain S-box-containing protein
MLEDLNLKIKALEEKIRILEIENSGLSDRAEDIFLFASTAESINSLIDEKEVYETALEKISILKSFPYCAFGTIGNGEVNIQYEYASFTEEENIVKIVLSPILKEKVLQKKIVIQKINKPNSGIDVKFNKNDFTPENILIISFANLRNQDGVFICMNNSKYDILDTARDSLKHSVMLVNSRLDNLFLMSQLEEQNLDLETKVAESTSELESEIKEHILTENALRLSEEKYRLFLENNNAIILTLDTETGTIIFANNAAVNFYGYEKNDLEGMNISKINILNPKEIELKMKTALDQKQNYFIFKHKLASGEIKEVEIYQTKYILNNKPIFLIIIHDISERRIAEESLAKFKLGIEHSSEAIFICEIDGNISYVNPSFEKIYGFSSSEVIGKTPRIIKSDNIPQEFYAEFWRKLINKEIVSGEVLNKRKDGKIITIDGSNNPIVDSNGEIIGYLGIHKDITQRKLEEELISSKEKAENASKMKSIFLAQMSHEIRTPINALVSMSSLLRFDFEAKADEDQLMSFEIIDRAANRIIRTVDLLLRLSEIQAGTYETNPVLLDLYAEVLSRIVADNRKFTYKKNIALSLDSKSTDTGITADLYTVSQIFIQLLENAIKYTDEGEISIVIFRNKSEQLVVEIKDTGIGIEEEYMPKLFDPFTQEEMGYTRKYEGNGIGLTLVKKYCELNNAKIEVESKKSEGSLFRVIF